MVFYNSTHLSVCNKVTLKVVVKLCLIDNILRREYFMTNSVLRTVALKKMTRQLAL